MRLRSESCDLELDAISMPMEEPLTAAVCIVACRNISGHPGGCHESLGSGKREVSSVLSCDERTGGEYLES